MERRSRGHGWTGAWKVAEEVGFEPTDGLPHLLISSQVPLTTQPPFRPLIIKHLRLLFGIRLYFYSLILQLVFMQTKTPDKIWQKAPVANLYRYVPTGVYYARPRIKGKEKSKCLETDKLSVAKLRLADFISAEQRKATASGNLINGKMTFGDAVEKFKIGLEADKNLKSRSKDYRLERLGALLRSWPNLASTDLAKIKEHDCEEWAATYGKNASATAFNNTVGTLRMILDIGIKCGARYDNPAQNIQKHRVRPKQLEIPSQSQFLQMVAYVDSIGFGRTKSCANLMRFLAYGGFRKSEAKRVTWADCDFDKGQITVK